ncbi:MAG: hypothetical protein QOH51_1718 [Acidobacteriota bacterium]|jgi:hypothetical protein|nr:hypothetical protein [Acidobacteriota bacterium]
MSIRKAPGAILIFALLASGAGRDCAQAVRAGDTQRAGDGERSGGGSSVIRGSLEEVKGSHRIALLVSKSLVVDARDPALGALEDYRKALEGSPPRPHFAAYRQIAQKLNKYIRKYRSATAARSFNEAELVIVFKVTRQRASIITGEPFIWGKMYVLAVGEGRVPRVLWESKGDESHIEDAIGDFIKALKTAHGEK